MLLSIDEIRSLLALSNLLDKNSLYKEADALDEVASVIIKSANLTTPKSIDLNSLAIQNGLKPVSYAGGVAYMLPSPRGKSDRYIGLWVGLSGRTDLGRGGNFKYVVQKAGGQPKIVNESRGFSFFGISQSEKKLLDQWLQHLTKEFKANPGAIPAAPATPVPPVDTNSNPPPEDNEYYDDEEYSDDEITGYEERPAAQTRQPASTTPEALDPNDISITKNHSLPIEEVKQKIDAVVNKLNRRLGLARTFYGIQVSNISGTWDGSRYNISQPCSGFAEVNNSIAQLVLYLSEKPDLIQHRQTIIDEINNAIRSEFN